jgi:hypothetical protein
MKSKGWIILAVLAVLAVGGAYLASPLLAFKALGEAAEAGDRDALERLVDFPAVRADLKAQLNTRLQGALQQDPALSQGPFGALGALLGPTIVDQVVNAAVTPEGVAAIVRSGRAPLSDIGAAPSAPAPPPLAAEPTAPAATPAAEPKRSSRFAYLDLNHVRASTITADDPAAPLGWVLERRGLFSWKLIRIELPPA